MFDQDPDYIYDAKVIRVIDGDTIELLVDLGFGLHFKMKARLYGIDTPETRTKDLEEKKLGMRAKLKTRMWCFRTKDEVIISSHDGNKLQQGKFGRWLVVVWNKHKECLNQFLLDNNLAEVKIY